MSRNWLAYRGAGALFDLQRTPYNTEVDLITSNPKKTRSNKLFSHTRQYLTNWPEKTVHKIKGATLSVNKLELETTTYQKLAPFTTFSDDEWSDFCSSLVSGGMTPVNFEDAWGGDGKLYATADFAANEAIETIIGGETVIRYTITRSSVAWDLETGTWYSVSVDIEYDAETPENLTYSFTQTPPTPFENYTFSADFGGGEVLAQDALDEISWTLQGGSSFCLRAPTDPAHGLRLYCGLADNVANPSRIASYKPAATDRLAGTSGLVYSGYVNQVKTECRFYYTPDACDDCWYKDKVVDVDIKYKKASVTETYYTANVIGGVYKTTSLGSWSDHSTVTKTLTLPSGHTKQLIGTMFEVPVEPGYIVAIDDIKLVSVT